MGNKVQLITVDIGRTLGAFTGVSTKDRLAELAPSHVIGPDRIAETVRSLLHRAPVLTDELIERVCQRLLISPADFPAESTWHRGYTPYHDTAQALWMLNEIAAVVALSNMAVTGGPQRVAAVNAAHPGVLAKVYTSFQLGGAKPEPWLWQIVAANHRADIGAVIHIGDRLDADVSGALSAGARVIHIHRPGDEPAHYPKGNDQRVATVPSLLDAVPVVVAWARRR